MANLGPSVGWGLAVAASLLFGGAVAALLKLPDRLAALITAFGGGTLLAAIAFELVPEADERAGLAPTALGLLAGTLIFVALTFGYFVLGPLALYLMTLQVFSVMKDTSLAAVPSS